MGYFKRKQTKKKGKRGTKKYRGGMNANAAKAAANSPANAAANAEKAAAKADAKQGLVNLFETLKNKIEELVPQGPADFNEINTHMADLNTKVDNYKVMFPGPETAM